MGGSFAPDYADFRIIDFELEFMSMHTIISSHTIGFHKSHLYLLLTFHIFSIKFLNGTTDQIKNPVPLPLLSLTRARTILF